jgi:acyl carrier protein
MEQIVFKQKVEAFLLQDPKNKTGQIELDTHLWDNGLVDSFRMVELVMFLEDLLSREIDINSNFTSNFHTIRKMYTALVGNLN